MQEQKEYGAEYLKNAEPAAKMLIQELLDSWSDLNAAGVKVTHVRFRHLMEIGAIRVGVHPSPERSEDISLADDIDPETGETFTVIILDPANAYRRFILENKEHLFLHIMYQIVDHYRLLRDSGVKVPAWKSEIPLPPLPHNPSV